MSKKPKPKSKIKDQNKQEKKEEKPLVATLGPKPQVVELEVKTNIKPQTKKESPPKNLLSIIVETKEKIKAKIQETLKPKQENKNSKKEVKKANKEIKKIKEEKPKKEKIKAKTAATEEKAKEESPQKSLLSIIIDKKEKLKKRIKQKIKNIKKASEKAKKEKIKAKNKQKEKRNTDTKSIESIKPIKIQKTKEKIKEKDNHTCKILKPQEWIFKKFKWTDKAFYTKELKLFFGRPIALEKTIKQAIQEIKEKNLKPDRKFKVLQKNKGTFSAEILIALKQRPEKPDPAIRFLSGDYITEYFQGDYSRIKNRIALFMNELSMKNYHATELMMWHVNCQKCHNKHGGAVTILIAKVEKNKTEA